MKNKLYYRHSGRFSVVGLLAGLGVGILTALPLACIYSYVTVYLPFVGIINAFFIFIMMLGVGGAGGAMLLKYKVRSVPATAAISFCVGLVLLHLCWAFWLYAAIRRSDGTASLHHLLMNPLDVWELVREVNRLAVAAGRGWPGSNWIVWGAEALAIVGGVMLMMHVQIVKNPFCEACGSWCTKQEGVCAVAIADDDEFSKRMEEKDFDYLKKLGKPEPGPYWIRLDLCSCPVCQTTNTLSAESMGRRDQSQFAYGASHNIFEGLLLTSGEAEKIRDLGKELPLPAA